MLYVCWHLVWVIIRIFCWEKWEKDFTLRTCYERSPVDLTRLNINLMKILKFVLATKGFLNRIIKSLYHFLGLARSKLDLRAKEI